MISGGVCLRGFLIGLLDSCSPADNGLNPAWLQTPFVFDVRNPSFCFLRFTVYDEDMFSDPNFLAQATYPVRSLRTGLCWFIINIKLCGVLILFVSLRWEVIFGFMTYLFAICCHIESFISWIFYVEALLSLIIELLSIIF
jgi:hypothetical protein